MKALSPLLSPILPRIVALAAVAVAVGCGGQVGPSSGGGDAGADADGSAPTPECHGYCPQPNGSTCGSDCDCYDKCLGGTDKAPRCADPIVPSIPCAAEAGACPSGQKCGAFGACEGAACGTSDDCPAHQQCQSGACVGVGCI